MAIVHDDVGRRRFLSQAVMGFGMLFGLGTLGFRFMQFLLPTRADKQSETVLIGAETRIPLGEAVPMDLGGHKILVLKTEDGVAAFSRRCTDLGCLVSWNKEREQFVCPCHQGTFDKNGSTSPVHPHGRSTGFRSSNGASSCTSISQAHKRNGLTRPHSTFDPKGTGKTSWIEYIQKDLPQHLDWWPYTLGAIPLTLFGILVATGLLLTFYYVPSPEKAYESVDQITNEIYLGWFVRGLHKTSVDLMILFLLFHVIRVFITRAYRTPGELKWVSGSIVLFVTLAMGFTGYSLVFDNVSYWGMTVVTNIDRDASRHRHTAAASAARR